MIPGIGLIAGTALSIADATSQRLGHGESFGNALWGGVGDGTGVADVINGLSNGDPLQAGLGGLDAIASLTGFGKGARAIAGVRLSAAQAAAVGRLAPMALKGGAAAFGAYAFLGGGVVEAEGGVVDKAFRTGLGVFRKGNRLIVSGQRVLHVASGASSRLVQTLLRAPDPFGDLLQATAANVAATWRGAQSMTARELLRINIYKSQGKYYRAYIAERQAFGRFVQREVQRRLQGTTGVSWVRSGVKGVDAIEVTGRRYELLAGSKSHWNVNRHAKRMFDDTFRMIIFHQP